MLTCCAFDQCHKMESCRQRTREIHMRASSPVVLVVNPPCHKQLVLKSGMSINRRLLGSSVDQVRALCRRLSLRRALLLKCGQTSNRSKVQIFGTIGGLLRFRHKLTFSQGCSFTWMKCLWARRMGQRKRLSKRRRSARRERSQGRRIRPHRTVTPNLK